MALIQDQDVIQALSTQAAQEAFADRVRPGCSIGCAQYLDACGDPCEGRAVLGVVVTDEVSRSFAEGSCVVELLGDSGIGGAPGHGKVDHAARSELDDDKDEHGAEEEIVGLHEIASPDLAGMVAQKGGPGVL